MGFRLVEGTHRLVAGAADPASRGADPVFPCPDLPWSSLLLLYPRGKALAEGNNMVGDSFAVAIRHLRPSCTPAVPRREGLRLRRRRG